MLDGYADETEYWSLESKDRRENDQELLALTPSICVGLSAVDTHLSPSALHMVGFMEGKL